MTRVAVAKWGNSTAVRLPRAIVDGLQLAPGQTVEMTLEDGKAIMSPTKAVKLAPTLEEMIAEMDRLGWENEPETVDWGPDVGSERFYDHE